MSIMFDKPNAEHHLYKFIDVLRKSTYIVHPQIRNIIPKMVFRIIKVCEMF